MPATITVTSSMITVGGIDQLLRNDLYADAPDPSATLADGGLRTCGANLLYCLERFPDAIWNDPGNRLVEARAYRFMQRVHAAEPGEYERNFPFKVPCDPHQLKLFTEARHLKVMALAPVALGTGKSKMILDVAADKFLRDEIDTLAIIAPNMVHRQWIDQAVPEHLSDSVERVAAVWKPRMNTTHRPWPWRADSRRWRLRIAAFNVEAFSTESGLAAEALKRFMLSGRCMLVLDESTRIKNYRATRTKTIIKAGNAARVRAILTGTPITRGLEDIFTQYQFLDENIIGLRNYFAFRGRYCITRPVRGRAGALGAQEIVGYRNQEELIRRIAPVSFMIPSTVLGLPAKRYEILPVALTDEQERVYKMLRDQLVEDLHAYRIENPSTVLTRMLRMQQVLCGRYYEQVENEDDMERTEARLLPSNRPEALATLLEAHDGQALVWCRFKADITDVVQAIGGLGRLGIIEGGVPVAERARQIQAFKDGQIDYMILNQATGSTGLDGLQCCSTSFYYSNSYNREQRWQSEGRTYRRGQQHSTFFGDFVATLSNGQQTVDRMILDAYAETEDLARSVMANPNMLQGEINDVSIPARPADDSRRRAAASNF